MSQDNWFLYCQEWQKSKIDSDPTLDGYSLHFSLDDLRKFVEQYRPEVSRDVPDEYLRPYGEPYLCKVELSKYGTILANDHGQMFTGKPPLPFKGGN